ncbi:hypothetical protein [Mycolicibacterium rhodesiae]|uniref:hypothetical protein n=1 Tax=Mycolicibacterium rhodesiae TaxID=36814 RepID=UPI0020A6AB98|nr:hypothetical protein [Mycolicibacterium rhodesiae]
MGDIVRYKDAPTRKPLQSAIALAVVFWALLIGGEAALPWSQGPDDHAPHALATVVSDTFAVVVDHPHVQQSAVLSPDTFVTAVLPRVATVLVALGLAVAVVAAWMYGGHGIWASMRGPPPGLAPIASGRDLLARICISRR